MKLIRRCIVVISAWLACSASMAQNWKSPTDLKAEEEAPAALLPFPREVKWQRGALALPSRDGWKVQGASSPMLRTAWKSFLRDCPGGKGQPVRVRLVKSAENFPDEAKEEGYKLSINAKGVEITAPAEAGLFYGLQTLRQLVQAKKLPYCAIEDYPAFRMRGYLQDCGRNFRELDQLKKEIDLASQVKVNVFHWHLTDHPGWRIQSKKYPELNAAKTRTRDLNDTYSYNEIRELFQYAKARNVTIIPELDMPGHSSYFPKAFGFKMESEKGMKICADLINEFCQELPKELCPYINFGADEVHIPNAKEFVYHICNTIKANGREHVQWVSMRDLVAHPDSIQMRWSEGAQASAYSLTNIAGRTLDYGIGYCNVYPPALMVRRYFFMRPCGANQGDAQRLGSVLGIWPDGKVDNKEWIPGMCNMWPAMCAMVERAWVGGGGDGDELITHMPAKDTEAGKAFYLFEQRMAKLRQCIFEKEDFPYWTESNISWKLVEPVAAAEVETTRSAVLDGRLDGLKTKDAHGASLYFRTRDGSGNQGMYRKAKTGVTLWAVTNITVQKSGQYPFMIGFDAPERSNRRWTGIPHNGQWSQTGTRIWINGTEVKNPRVYQHAGKNVRMRPYWNFNEPLLLEELWWMLSPTKLPLRKGENTIAIEQPYAAYHQDWGISFIPLFKHQ